MHHTIVIEIDLPHVIVWEDKRGELVDDLVNVCAKHADGESFVVNVADGREG